MKNEDRLFRTHRNRLRRRIREAQIESRNPMRSASCPVTVYCGKGPKCGATFDGEFFAEQGAYKAYRILISSLSDQEGYADKSSRRRLLGQVRELRELNV